MTTKAKMPQADAADLAGLYRCYSARLAAHAAEYLGSSAGLQLVDDVLGEVWLQLAERDAAGELPTGFAVWPALVELVAITAAEQQGEAYREVATETVVPAVSPLAGVPRRIVAVVSRVDGPHGAAFYTADSGAVVGLPTVVTTQQGHWYATYDALNSNNDRSCRGCEASGHFDYILDAQGDPAGCPSPATADDIRDALWVVPGTPVKHALRRPAPPGSRTDRQLTDAFYRNRLWRRR